MSPDESAEYERTTRIPIDTKKAPDDATGVDLYFTLSGRITGGGYGEHKVSAKPRPGLLSLRWRTPTPRKKLPTALALRHLDNPPRLLKTQWHPAPNGSPKTAMATTPSTLGHYAQRKRRILAATQPGTPLRAMALAMCTFDQKTDPDELSTKAAKQVRDLTIYLRFRWLQRAGWAVHEREFEPSARHDDGACKTATAVEVLVRKALQSAFPRKADPDGIDLPLLEATFAAFVAGELRMTRFDPPPHPPDPLEDDGIPDGDYYFSFAECALLFIRLKLHAAFWQRVLPIFVCGDGFFASCFWNRRDRRRDAYRPANCKRDAAVSSTAILVWHEQRIRTMTLAQLAAEHSRTVGHALRDDPGRPRPNCTAKEFQ